MTDPAASIGGIALVLLAVIAAWRIGRAAISSLRGRQPENVLTIVAAVIATVVQADGMWIFFRDIVPVPVYLRVLMFAFLEVALFTSGLRARRNIKETEEHAAGVDGMAVWVLAAISGTLASTTAGSFRGALLRLTAAAVAAWLWERGLSGERRRARKKDSKREHRINWRITPERVLVRLGVAEASDRTADEVDAQRRLTKLARAAMRVRVLDDAGVSGWRVRSARRHLNAAMVRAVEYADLATDTDRQDALLAQLGTLYNAEALAYLTPDAPWVEPPRVTLVRKDGSPWVPPAPDDVPDPDGVPDGLDALIRQARNEFAAELEGGKTPTVRELKRALRVGQNRATAVRAYLPVLR